MWIPAVQTMIAASIGLLLLVAFRWVWRQSPMIGAILAAAILVRAAVGTALFWVSYLDLPLGRSLHSGDGFWSLAPDSRMYFDYGATAIQSGFASLPQKLSSPFFVTTVASWMRLVGIAPSAGVFLNLLLLVGTCVLLVWVYRPQNDWRRDLPCAVMIAALSLSPVQVIHSSQVMKDQLFAGLMTLVAIGAVGVLLPLVQRAGAARVRSFRWGLLALAAAAYAIGGIRPYYAVIAWGSLAVVLILFIVRQPPRRLVAYACTSCLVLGVMWTAYGFGAGSDYVGPKSASPSRLASELQIWLEISRFGFLMRPGETNMVAPDAPGGRDGPAAERLRAGFIGMTALVVPISALKALSIVEFSGGRGLLAIADVDTLFGNAAIASVLTLLVRRRREIGERLPFVVFGLVLAAVTAALLGYVVINFGTLFRLRYLMSVPIWLLPLALASRERRGATARVATLVTAPGPVARGERPAVLWISYDGVLEPLGESQVVSYAEQLAGGAAVAILSYEKPEDLLDSRRVEAMRARLQAAGLSWFPLRYHYTPRLVAKTLDLVLGWRSAQRWMRRTQHQPRIIHARGYPAALLALGYKLLGRARFLFDMRGYWVDWKVDLGHWKRRGVLHRLGKHFERRFLAGADAIVVLSRAAFNDLATLGAIPSTAHVQVIPTCVDLERFRRIGDRCDRRRAAGLDGVVVGCVGTLSHSYQRAETLNYLALLARRLPRMTALIVTREDHESLREAALRAGIPPGQFVLRRASFDEMPALIALMDVGVFFVKPLVSMRAAAPTKLGEFLACGVPVVIAGPLADAGEIVRRGRVGLVLDGAHAEEHERSVAALRDLLADDDTPSRCRSVAAAEFSIDRAVAAYDDLYQRLAARQVGPERSSSARTERRSAAAG